MSRPPFFNPLRRPEIKSHMTIITMPIAKSSEPLSFLENLRNIQSSPSLPNLCTARIEKHRVFEILINYTKYFKVREYSEAHHGYGYKYCRVKEWRVTLGVPWPYPPFPASCPFRLSIALFHPLPPKTVREVFPHTAFLFSSQQSLYTYQLGVAFG